MEPEAEIAPGEGLWQRGLLAVCCPAQLDARGESMKTWLTTSERLPRSASSLEFEICCSVSFK